MTPKPKQLLDWGWSILPVPHQKKHPVIPWTKFQKQPATTAQIEEWWPSPQITDNRSQTTEQGIAVVCGEVSKNLVCLDFDFRHAFFAWYEVNKGLYDLPIAKSPRGYHVFFRTVTPLLSGRFGLAMSRDRAIEILTDKCMDIENVSFLDPTPNTQHSTPNACGPVGDLISDGKLVVIPPTLHPLGVAREWIVEPTEEIPIIDLNDIGIVRWPPQEESGQFAPRPCPVGPFPEGARHSSLCSIAARLQRANISPELTVVALQEVNKLYCQPPLAENEVNKIAAWANRLPPMSYPSDKSYTSYDPYAKESEEELILLAGKRDTDIKGKVAYIPGPHTALDPEVLEKTFQSCDEYLDENEEQDLDWLVEGFMPKGYLVVLGGTSKAGKSCFLTAMAMAVAKGESFLGLKTDQAPVLWSCYEESRGERKYALRQYADIPNNLYITHEKPMIDTEEGQAILRHWIKKTEAKLLVVDPLYGANEAQSLTDGKSARNALQGLKELCNETGVCAIVIHHFTKNVGAGLVRERLADSNQIVAVASMDVLMDADEQSDGSRLIRLKCKGRGIFANQTWVVKSKAMTDFRLIANGQGITVDSIQRENQVVELLEKVADEAITEGKMVPGLTSEEIAERTCVHPKTMKNLLTHLTQKGIIREAGKRGRWKLYVSISVNTAESEAA